MSTVPDAYEALQAAITTGVASLDVQVVMGSPVSVTTLGPDLVYIGEIVGTRSAGSRNRVQTTTRNIPFGTAQDEFTIEIVIAVSRSVVTDMVALLRAADDVLEAVRNAIEGMALVSGIFEALPTGDFSFKPESDSNGRYVTTVLGVDFTARD
jgi:hypothetical protein